MSSDKKIYSICALVLLAAGLFGYWLGSHGFGNGSRDANITTQLDEAIRNQHRITTELEGIKRLHLEDSKRIGRIEEGNRRMEELARATLDKIQQSDKLVTESGKLDIEDQRIISDILKRNESKSKAGTN